ncbi:hypothetical protein SAMN06296273_1346 [Nitrosomonas ureae]|uniref:Uncharacterized protein n=1 Tax=Nitrosomonas ureae TaxID=44577 RepID=A0A285BXC9_9PROT|nr:hypothetical protein [Nitrosomonas ureae]SNX59902.1 hypothetical protein SAMN06296273_1346 [Nitrosomonas ureae]
MNATKAPAGYCWTNRRSGDPLDKILEGCFRYNNKPVIQQVVCSSRSLDLTNVHFGKTLPNPATATTDDSLVLSLLKFSFLKLKKLKKPEAVKVVLI